MKQKNHNFLTKMSVAFIDLYRAASSCFLPHCRYAPSCSEYSREAILQMGVMKGGWLAFRRIIRCHPLGGHGFDPIPPIR
jgi:putative membrane protein insertion efficiency factor